MEGCCQVEQGTCKAPEPPPGSDDAPARGHKRKKNANLCCGSRPTLSVAPSPTATRMVAISLLLAGTGAAPPMQCDSEITIPLCTFCHDDFLRKAGAAAQPAVPAMQNRAEHDGRLWVRCDRRDVGDKGARTDVHCGARRGLRGGIHGACPFLKQKQRREVSSAGTRHEAGLPKLLQQKVPDGAGRA